MFYATLAPTLQVENSMKVRGISSSTSTDTQNYETQNYGIIYPAFSVVIPAYNKENRIIFTLNNLRDYLDRAGCEYEIIVVNDGSSDGTGDLLRSQLDIKLIEHQRHLGCGAAIKTGIRQAKYPLIVMTDADGTYPNDKIPQLVTLMLQADMVMTTRVAAAVKESNLHKTFNWCLIHFAQWLTTSSIPDLSSCLWVFRKDVAEKFLNILPDTFSFNTTTALVMQSNNYIVRYEPIYCHYQVKRNDSKSIKNTLEFIKAIIYMGIYFAPLRFLFPLVGVLFAGFLLTLMRDIISHQSLSQFTLLLFFSSTQLGIFALLADMICRGNKNRNYSSSHN